MYVDDSQPAIPLLPPPGPTHCFPMLSQVHIAIYIPRSVVWDALMLTGMWPSTKV